MLVFDYIERPPLEAFNRALSQLWLLGALTHEGKLSDLGKASLYFSFIIIFLIIFLIIFIIIIIVIVFVI